MSPDPIQIRVLREAGMWRVRYGDVMLEYESHSRALAASIELAQTLGREGQFSAVVMGMITSLYGPSGFIQTVPNRRKSDQRTYPLDEMPSSPHLDVLLEVEGSPLVPETPPGIVKQPAEERRRKAVDEKPPRLLQIATAFDAVDE